jgi:hypothetical protein
LEARVAAKQVEIGIEPQQRGSKRRPNGALQQTFQTGNRNILLAKARCDSRAYLFKPLCDIGFFRRVTIAPDGVPEWSDDVDLSPDSLRAWCEAGRFLDYEETDVWIEQHSSTPEKVV